MSGEQTAHGAQDSSGANQEWVASLENWFVQKGKGRAIVFGNPPLEMTRLPLCMFLVVDFHVRVVGG